MKKQDLKANLIISGPIFPEPVQVMMTHDMGHLVKVIGKGLRTDKFYDPILDADQLDTHHRVSREVNPSTVTLFAFGSASKACVSVLPMNTILISRFRSLVLIRCPTSLRPFTTIS